MGLSEGAMDKQRVLYVGCGHDREAHEIFTGWELVRLDVDPGVRPDIVASMTQMRPVAPASMDAVYSRHNLEHLEYHEVGLALAEFRRVLKPGGFALIIVPDLQTVAELVVQGKLEDTIGISPAGPIAPIDMIYGFRPALKEGKYFMAHRMGFTQRTLTRHIVSAGFFAGVVRTTGTRELWAEARTVKGEPDYLAKLFPNAGPPIPISSVTT
jgi:SAM-dependent methyltransferase